MNFTVTARVSARRFAFQHASILNALDQGMSLIAAGMADVRITDAGGIARTPEVLYQSMFGSSSKTNAQSQPVVSQALAAWGGMDADRRIRLLYSDANRTLFRTRVRHCLIYLRFILSTRSE